MTLLPSLHYPVYRLSAALEGTTLAAVFPISLQPKDRCGINSPPMSYDRQLFATRPVTPTSVPALGCSSTRASPLLVGRGHHSRLEHAITNIVLLVFHTSALQNLIYPLSLLLLAPYILYLPSNTVQLMHWRELVLWIAINKNVMPPHVTLVLHFVMLKLGQQVILLSDIVIRLVVLPHAEGPIPQDLVLEVAARLRCVRHWGWRRKLTAPYSPCQGLVASGSWCRDRGFHP